MATAPSATPIPSDGPTTLRISEFLADPAAVADNAGEWLELTNTGNAPVNLRGWVLADLGSDRHLIAADLMVEPGAYVVLARNGDPATNGGVAVDYVYAGLSLANGADELLLLAPDGTEVDRIGWGEGDQPRPRAGASLERQADGTWSPATVPWPNSVGDLGTPGAPPYAGAPFTPTPGATSVLPDLTPIPTTTPATTPTVAVELPERWPAAAEAGTIRIDEVAFAGSDEEYVVLVNTGATSVDVGGWLVGDAQTPGSGEGLYALPAGWMLAPGGRLVLARNGAAFAARFVRWPDGEFEDSAGTIPDLVRRTDLAKGEFALKDGGDEVVLLAPALALVDALVYRDGDYAALGRQGRLDPRRCRHDPAGAGATRRGRA